MPTLTMNVFKEDRTTPIMKTVSHVVFYLKVLRREKNNKTGYLMTESSKTWKNSDFKKNYANTSFHNSYG